MVDLNTLIPFNSSLELTFAFAINDGGEIVGTGLPAGCAPENIEFCGHAYVLIPCDDDHPGIEGCDYGMADTTAASDVSSATPSAKVATPLNEDRPALGSSPNPMLRRFWTWHRGAEKSQGFAGKPTIAAPASAAEAGEHSGPLLERSEIDQLLDPQFCYFGHCSHRGYCEVSVVGNQWELNGVCFAQEYPLCSAATSSRCPTGKKVSTSFDLFCGGLSAVPVSGQYPCSFSK